LTKGAFRANL